MWFKILLWKIVYFSIIFMIIMFCSKLWFPISVVKFESLVLVIRFLYPFSVRLNSGIFTKYTKKLSINFIKEVPLFQKPLKDKLSKNQKNGATWLPVKYSKVFVKKIMWWRGFTGWQSHFWRINECNLEFYDWKHHSNFAYAKCFRLGGLKCYSKLITVNLF